MLWLTSKKFHIKVAISIKEETPAHLVFKMKRYTFLSSMKEPPKRKELKLFYQKLLLTMLSMTAMMRFFVSLKQVSAV